MKWIIILLTLISCSWQLSPEEVALLYMKNRYFNPPQAYKMLKAGQIEQKEFLLKHDLMLRIKDFKLNSKINFTVVKSKVNNSKAEVEIKTIRPDIQKVFKNFYHEKIKNQWNKKQIKIEMIKRLNSPNVETEELIETIKLEKTSEGWRVLFKN